jgi:molecular chaperone IbpA
MTNWKLDHTFADLDKFNKFFIGADKFADRMTETVNYLANSAAHGTYPPFNLKKTDDNKYVIEMAVAGFGKNDLEMTLEENKLIVKGSTTLDTLTSDGIDQTFLHKGISDRPFTRSFTLADNVVVNNAGLVNGLLKIWLEHIIPEDKKPKKINIEDVAEPKQTVDTTQLLNEGR